MLTVMNPKSIRHYLRTTDRRTLGLKGCFIVICLMALILRYRLIAAETFDYTVFLKPWYDYLNTKGLSAFHDNFANYNTPYLVLLYLATFLPIGPLGAVKSISIAFDLVLALAVAMTVAHFKPRGITKYIAFATVLYLPTVFLNSSLWGQCDGIYTSFVIFSLLYSLKDRPRLAWIFWGIAFAFKLQAIFFLPFLIFMTIHKMWKWRTALWALLVFALLSVLPILEGRSILSTLNIYVSQAIAPTADQEMLAWFSPTFYQLLPNEFFFQLKSAGLILGGAAAVVTIAIACYAKKIPMQTLLVVATASLLAIPYFLPQIHERYLFSSEIALVILAFVIPRFAWAAIAMQIVTIITYNSYFTGANRQPQIPYPILSLVVLGILYALTKTIINDLAPAAQADSHLKKIAASRRKS